MYFYRSTVLFILISQALLSFALQLPLPDRKTDLVGQLKYQITQDNDNFMHLSRLYSTGFHELIEANPNISAWHPLNGETVLLPTQFILPDAPRDGLIVNLAELRLYYFDKTRQQLLTYPVGIGKREWMSPLGKHHISHKMHKPTWHVPKSIQAHYAKQGKKLPAQIPPGPKNPLGKYAMRLSHSSYLIHGTNQVMGISRRTSSGCISLFPEDINNLFRHVKIGTPVYIVNQPYKIGRKQDKLYLEVHQPLYEFKQSQTEINQAIMRAVLRYNQSRNYALNWTKITQAIESQQGIPVVIGQIKKGSNG